MELKFRQLTLDELELKACMITKDRKHAQLLIYKTARADMNVLDDTVGIYWQSSYQMIGETLFCTIKIYDKDTNEWLSRTDAGDTGNDISPEKSQASSAFKRAASQWGIGRYLYNTPRIWVNLNEGDLSQDGKRLTTSFTVSKLDVDDNGIVTDLVVTDAKGNVRYKMGDTKTVNITAPTNKELEYKDDDVPPAEEKSRKELLKEWCCKLKEEYPDEGDNIKAFYKKTIDKLDTIKIFNYNVIKKFFKKDYIDNE